MRLQENQIERLWAITCVMKLNIRDHYLRNSFRQQEEKKLVLGTVFEIYTSRFNIYLKEIQIQCDES